MGLYGLARTDANAAENKNGGSEGARTRGVLSDRRSNQLNYTPVLRLYLFPAIPSDGLAFPSVPFGRAVTEQRSANSNFSFRGMFSLVVSLRANSMSSIHPSSRSSRCILEPAEFVASEWYSRL